MSLPRFRSSVGSPRPASPLLRAMGAICLHALLVGVLCFAGAGRTSAADSSEEDDTKPQDLSLKTSDGLELKATFYPSTLKKKKEATVVVLLHALKGDRGDCASLALFLQKLGHAVITPDLRGHGESTLQVLPNGARRELSPATLGRDDYERMVGVDMEKIKDFIRQKNNDGELNMENLCVVGIEMGSTVALRWAALDWAWPILNTGKQGQDVKALVLISPVANLNGFGYRDVVDMVGRCQISCLIMAGNKGNSKILKDAKQLNDKLTYYHPAPPPDEAVKLQTLFFEPLETSLQGSNLLNEKSLNVNHRIAKFIELRVVKQPTPWEERKKL